MRAMALVGSFGLDHLKLIERPMPEPRHNEVVIRMAAVSLNYRDMGMVLGTTSHQSWIAGRYEEDTPRGAPPRLHFEGTPVARSARCDHHVVDQGRQVFEE